jgi:hypothetical protein
MIGAAGSLAHTISVAAFCAVAAMCTSKPGNDQQREGSMPGKTIQAVLQEHSDSLMSLPGVVGTAIGHCEGKPCIKVLVAKKTPALLGKIPSTLEGFPVAVEETGEIRALDSA